MKAYIEGVEALKEADPSVRILTTEPLVNIVAAENATMEELRLAAIQNEHQHQVTEILSGRMCPELRGNPAYLDILGYNYYYTNQWVHQTNERLGWGGDDLNAKFVPLRKLLATFTKDTNGL